MPGGRVELLNNMSSFAEKTNEQIYNEIIGLLPPNHDDAMELVLRLQRFVYHQKTRACETHFERMLQLSTQKNEERTRRLLEENARLVQERDQLTHQHNALQHVTNSIHHNLASAMDTSASRAGALGITPPDRAQLGKEQPIGSSHFSPAASTVRGSDAMGMSDFGLVSAIDQSFRSRVPGSVSSYHNPLSPSATLRVSPQYGSPSSSKYTSPLGASRASLTTAMPASVPASTSSPASLVTGKAFFRECRTRLKPVVFDAFLELVKQLNRNEITREDAVQKSKEILGSDQMELVGSFRTLLFG